MDIHRTFNHYISIVLIFCLFLTLPVTTAQANTLNSVSHSHLMPSSIFQKADSDTLLNSLIQIAKRTDQQNSWYDRLNLQTGISFFYNNVLKSPFNAVLNFGNKILSFGLNTIANTLISIALSPIRILSKTRSTLMILAVSAMIFAVSCTKEEDFFLDNQPEDVLTDPDIQHIWMHEGIILDGSAFIATREGQTLVIFANINTNGELNMTAYDIDTGVDVDISGGYEGGNGTIKIDSEPVNYTLPNGNSVNITATTKYPVRGSIVTIKDTQGNVISTKEYPGYGNPVGNSFSLTYQGKDYLIFPAVAEAPRSGDKWKMNILDTETNTLIEDSDAFWAEYAADNNYTTAETFSNQLENGQQLLIVPDINGNLSVALKGLPDVVTDEKFKWKDEGLMAEGSCFYAEREGRPIVVYSIIDYDGTPQMAAYDLITGEEIDISGGYEGGNGTIKITYSPITQTLPNGNILKITNSDKYSVRSSVTVITDSEGNILKETDYPGYGNPVGNSYTVTSNGKDYLIFPAVAEAPRSGDKWKLNIFDISNETLVEDSDAFWKNYSETASNTSFEQTLANGQTVIINTAADGSVEILLKGEATAEMPIHLWSDNGVALEGSLFLTEREGKTLLVIARTALDYTTAMTGYDIATGEEIDISGGYVGSNGTIKIDSKPASYTLADGNIITVTDTDKFSVRSSVVTKSDADANIISSKEYPGYGNPVGNIFALNHQNRDYLIFPAVAESPRSGDKWKINIYDIANDTLISDQNAFWKDYADANNGRTPDSFEVVLSNGQKAVVTPNSDNSTFSIALYAGSGAPTSALNDASPDFINQLSAKIAVMKNQNIKNPKIVFDTIMPLFNNQKQLASTKAIADTMQFALEELKITGRKQKRTYIIPTSAFSASATAKNNIALSA